MILTTDECGAVRQLHDAVERAHFEGVLTAANLMVGAPEAADAVARVSCLSSRRLGPHLGLAEGGPMLLAHVPELVNRSGAFCTLYAWLWPG